MAENNNENKIRKNLEDKFKQLLSKEEEVPASLKKEVFSTLDTLHLLGDMADLFTSKFTQTETSFLDMIQDEEEQTITHVTKIGLQSLYDEITQNIVSMEDITNWSQLFFESLRTFGQTFMSAMPSVLGAFLILLLGWLFARLVSGGIGRLLKVIKFDKLADRIQAGQLLEKANIKLTPSALIGKFFYWILMLLVITTAADTVGWTAISEEISKLLSFLPNLLSAIVFFTVGVYIATFVRDIIQGATRTLGISTGRVIGGFVFYLLFLLVTLTALDQAGIDTSIITSNLLLIIGAIMAAAAISYGIASKDVLANILAAFFSRKTFVKGQIIEIDGERGEIVEVSNVAVILQLSRDEKLVVPTHQLITNRVKIISK